MNSIIFWDHTKGKAIGSATLRPNTIDYHQFVIPTEAMKLVEQARLEGLLDEDIVHWVYLNG